MMSMEEAMLSMSMGTHKRLGENSAVRHIDRDVLQMVSRFASFLTAKQVFEGLRELLLADGRVVVEIVGSQYYRVKSPNGCYAGVTYSNPAPWIVEVIVEVGGSFPGEIYKDGDLKREDVMDLRERVVDFVLDPVPAGLVEMEDLRQQVLAYIAHQPIPRWRVDMDAPAATQTDGRPCFAVHLLSKPAVCIILSIVHRNGGLKVHLPGTFSGINIVTGLWTSRAFMENLKLRIDRVLRTRKFRRV